MRTHLRGISTAAGIRCVSVALYIATEVRFVARSGNVRSKARQHWLQTFCAGIQEVHVSLRGIQQAVFQRAFLAFHLNLPAAGRGEVKETRRHAHRMLVIRVKDVLFQGPGRLEVWR